MAFAAFAAQAYAYEGSSCTNEIYDYCTVRLMVGTIDHMNYIDADMGFLTLGSTTDIGTLYFSDDYNNTPWTVVTYEDGSTEYMVTTVPEPSTVASILGLGALGFAAFCRRHRAK